MYGCCRVQTKNRCRRAGRKSRKNPWADWNGNSTYSVLRMDKESESATGGVEFSMNKGLEDSHFTTITQRLVTLTLSLDKWKLGIFGCCAPKQCLTDEIRKEKFYKRLLSTFKILEDKVDENLIRGTFNCRCVKDERIIEAGTIRPTFNEED